MTLTDLALVECFAHVGFVTAALHNGRGPMPGAGAISYCPSAIRTLSCAPLDDSRDTRWHDLAFKFLRNGRMLAQAHRIGADVGKEGFVGGADACEAMGRSSASPEFRASLSAGTVTEGPTIVFEDLPC